MTDSGQGSDAQPREPQQEPPPQQPGEWQAPPQQPGAWQAPPPPQSGWQQQAPPQPGGWQGPPPAQGGWQGPPPAQGGGWQPPQGGNWTPPTVPPSSWSPPPVEQGPAAGITYAGFVVRLIAYIIDGILLAIVNAIFSAILRPTSFDVYTGQFSYNYGALLITTVISLAISAAYFIYTWSNMRASPGDRVLGLMVLNEADGSPLTMNQSALRWLILAGPGALSSLVIGAGGTGIGIGALVGLLVFLWYIYLAWTTATDPKRQGFHDKYVHSVVVKATLR